MKANESKLVMLGYEKITSGKLEVYKKEDTAYVVKDGDILEVFKALNGILHMQVTTYNSGESQIKFDVATGVQLVIGNKAVRYHEITIVCNNCGNVLVGDCSFETKQWAFVVRADLKKYLLKNKNTGITYDCDMTDNNIRRLTLDYDLDIYYGFNGIPLIVCNSNIIDFKTGVVFDAWGSMSIAKIMKTRQINENSPKAMYMLCNNFLMKAGSKNNYGVNKIEENKITATNITTNKFLLLDLEDVAPERYSIVSKSSYNFG